MNVNMNDDEAMINQKSISKLLERVLVVLLFWTGLKISLMISVNQYMIMIIECETEVY